MTKNNFSSLNGMYLVFKSFKIFRETFFLVIFLITITKFFHLQSTYAYLIAILILIFRISKTLLYWLSFKYKVNNLGIEIRKGIFNPSSNYISIENIKEINEHRPFLYRLINASMLYIYTDDNKKDGKIQLEFITTKNAKDIIKKLKNISNEQTQNDNYSYSYICSKKEMFISSLSPINILLFSLFVFSIVDNLNKYFKISISLDVYLSLLKNNLWILIVTIIPYFFLSSIYMYIKTFLKFGNYKLLDNNDEIIIKKGIINKSEVTLSKARIQGLTVKWSLIQKFCGIVKIEVITSKNENDDENKLKSDLLLPFIYRKNAKILIKEILPQFNLDFNLNKLHKITVCRKIFVSAIILSIINIVISHYLNSFKLLSVLISFLIFTGKILEGLFSEYKYNNNIYYKKANLVTSLVIIPKHRIEEYNYTQNFIQRKLNLLTLKTIIRQSPTKKIKIFNIPIQKKEANKKNNL